MPDIPALLQPMKDRLAAATPGPWEWSGSNLERCSPGYGDVLEVEVECGSYCYGGSPRMNISAGNKALLENAPTDQAKLIAAIEGVTKMHRPINQDFITALPCIREECECENECPTEELPVCLHCWSQLEQIDPYFGEQHHVSEVMWPCPTNKALTQALGGDRA
jgi:hypothetical protein